MNLSAAQLFLLDLCENANFGRSYKAPHANRGTLARPHYPRLARRRLFKGWRP